MPAVHSIMCAAYLCLSLATILITLHAMFDSFIAYNAAVAVFQGGVQRYAAEATVGLVVKDGSSEIFLCAVSGHEPWLTTVAASIVSFSGCHKLDATGVALLNERGAVCVSFADSAKLQAFVTAFESARAACADKPTDADVAASCDLADSAFLSLIASELVEGQDMHASTPGEGEGDSDWDLVDANVEL